jgi:hypothetical protein
MAVLPMHYAFLALALGAALGAALGNKLLLRNVRERRYWHISTYLLFH